MVLYIKRTSFSLKIDLQISLLLFVWGSLYAEIVSGVGGDPIQYECMPAINITVHFFSQNFGKFNGMNVNALWESENEKN